MKRHVYSSMVRCWNRKWVCSGCWRCDLIGRSHANVFNSMNLRSATNGQWRSYNWSRGI